jgi:hypothetical protein
MDAVRWLRESGVGVAVAQQEPDAAKATQADAVLDLTVGGQRARFAVEMKQRTPYPGELGSLRQLRQALSREGEPLLVVPFVREDLGEALSRAGWSWADSVGNFDVRAPGLVLRQRRPMKLARAPRTRLPRGSGSFAVMRALIRFGDSEEEGAGATALARQAGVSQPRASQVLGQLQDQHLVERAKHGQWRPQRQELLDRFIAEYPGPGGSEQFFYSLDAPADVGVRAAGILSDQVAISADVGPDLIEPWRRPSTLILYARELIDPASLELVEAQARHDANVIIRMPADQSVFGVPPALVSEIRGHEVRLADPAQMIWDLLDLGGADRAEAAGRLREWLLTSR